MHDEDELKVQATAEDLLVLPSRKIIGTPNSNSVAFLMGEKENLQQRLLLSQMTPHFLFNSLNVISHLVDKNDEKTIPYVHKLANLYRQILNNSRDEFVEFEEEVKLIENYLAVQSNFSANFEYECNYDELGNTEGVLIPPMLIQPFIENSIVHGFTNFEEKKIIMNKNQR